MNRYDELLALVTEAQTLWYRLKYQAPRVLVLKARERFDRRADALDAYVEDQVTEADIARVMAMTDEEILALPVSDDEEVTE